MARIGSFSPSSRDMTLKPNPYFRLAEAVAEVLERSGPLNAREIARELRRVRWGYPQPNLINKVLAGEHLRHRVELVEGRVWRLVATGTEDPHVE